MTKTIKIYKPVESKKQIDIKHLRSSTSNDRLKKFFKS